MLAMLLQSHYMKTLGKVKQNIYIYIYIYIYIQGGGGKKLTPKDQNITRKNNKSMNNLPPVTSHVE